MTVWFAKNHRADSRRCGVLSNWWISLAGGRSLCLTGKRYRQGGDGREPDGATTPDAGPVWRAELPG